MHHEIDLADLPRLTRDDGLCAWAAQDGARAWADGTAVAVAAPGLSRRDRLVVHGERDALVPLVRAVFDEVGATYRPLGAPELVRALADGIDGLSVLGEFAWMERRDGEAGTAPGTGPKDAEWLEPADEAHIAALIDDVFPDSYARPGLPGVLRWAGIRGADGRPAAVAAEAWSAPAMGFLSGVAVDRSARGAGLGRRVCGFLVDAILAERGRVGLMVDDWNAPAERLYRKLGFGYRRLAAAAMTQPV